MMSFWTVGVAVAVRAMTGAGRRGEEVAEGAVVGGESRGPRRRCQWASSMANERGFLFCEHRGEVWDAHSLGCNEEEL